jgi:uncharacterized SAM-binding protein YcdF (DUF218 family)
MDSTTAAAKKSKGLAFRIFLVSLAALLVLTISTTVALAFGVGKWLVREDPLQQATAIAVLSGNIPTRALEAAELYHHGYAKEIWLTHPDSHDSALKALGVSYPSEDAFNIRVLRRAGVPAQAIHVLDQPITNTAEELNVISAELSSRGGDKIIIVTNKSHTRRVHILWTKYCGTRGEAIVHGISDDDYVANDWWRDPGSMSQVTHEVLGIVNAWAGLPVHRDVAPTPEVVAADAKTAPPQHAAAD